MPLPRKPRPSRRRFLLPLLAAAAVLPAGCTEDAPKVAQRYPSLPNRQVPAYMEDTVYQYTDMAGTEAFPVSGYGLVANLRGTGGSRVPTPVRDYIAKELSRHQFGSLATGWDAPDKILDSKNFAVVRVDGFLPPGARAGADWSTWFDVRVSALPESDTASLAHGDLYQCDLKINGANPTDPGNGQVSIKGQAAGAVFVNPAYVLDSTTDTPAARGSRRTGVVMAGARAMEDRPLILRLRAPERRLARAIERRVIERFQDVADDDLQSHGNSAAKKVANAQDEAVVYVYVPRCYAEDWSHFAGVVRHLYLKGADPAFAAKKAIELAAAAGQAGAPLLDISYAWEGLGKPALFALDPLLTDARPAVRFAAARAAAFIGDPASVEVLLDIAGAPGNPFRVNAVQTLAAMTPSPHIDALVRTLLDSDQATVRIEAYKLLAKHNDPAIFTRWVKEGDKEIFALDIVRSGSEGVRGPGRGAVGVPLVYATRQGVPRVVVFGSQTSLDLPLMFTALDGNRLTIGSDGDGDRVRITYRSPYRKDVVSVECGPDLPELVAHLGGDGNVGPGSTRLHLGYADVVAVVQALVDGRNVSGQYGDGRQLASFVLQDPARVAEQPVDTSGLVRQPAVGRPVSDQPAKGGTPTPDDGLLRNPPPPTSSTGRTSGGTTGTAVAGG